MIPARILSFANNLGFVDERNDFPVLLKSQVVFPDSASEVSISCAESKIVVCILLPRSPSNGRSGPLNVLPN